jgi:hypothetical protein
VSEGCARTFRWPSHVGTLKSGRSRSVALPAFVVDELAATCTGKDRDELIWLAQDGAT